MLMPTSYFSKSSQILIFYCFCKLIVDNKEYYTHMRTLICAFLSVSFEKEFQSHLLKESRPLLVSGGFQPTDNAVVYLRMPSLFVLSLEVLPIYVKSQQSNQVTRRV